jgi:hypothetical protein
VVFSLLFFALFCVIFLLAGRFVPELFSIAEGESGSSFAPGTGSGASSVFSDSADGVFPSGDDEVDNIEGEVYPSATQDFAQQDIAQNIGNDASPQGGLDQGTPEGYNKEKENSAQTGVSAPQQAGDDLAPDFDVLSEAFSSNSGSGEAGIEAVFDDVGPKSGSKKKDALKGDFDAKELAQAIQTILKKDEKGL